jgi:hypothetical protein
MQQTQGGKSRQNPCSQGDLCGFCGRRRREWQLWELGGAQLREAAPAVPAAPAALPTAEGGQRQLAYCPAACTAGVSGGSVRAAIQDDLPPGR